MGKVSSATIIGSLPEHLFQLANKITFVALLDGTRLHEFVSSHIHLPNHVRDRPILLPNEIYKISYASMKRMSIYL